MIGYAGGGHGSGYKAPPDQYHPGPETESEGKEGGVEMNPDISDMMTSREHTAKEEEEEEDVGGKNE